MIATTQSLAEYKMRALNAELSLEDSTSSSKRTTELEAELKEKNALIGKMRYDSASFHPTLFIRAADVQDRRRTKRASHRGAPTTAQELERQQRRPTPCYQRPPPIPHNTTSGQQTLRDAHSARLDPQLERRRARKGWPTTTGSRKRTPATDCFQSTRRHQHSRRDGELQQDVGRVPDERGSTGRDCARRKRRRRWPTQRRHIELAQLTPTDGCAAWEHTSAGECGEAVDWITGDGHVFVAAAAGEDGGRQQGLFTDATLSLRGLVLYPLFDSVIHFLRACPRLTLIAFELACEAVEEW